MSKVETALVFAGIPLVIILLVVTLVYAPVTTKPVASRPIWAAWLSPSRVVLLGTVVVALLLTMPISVRRPGDHEQMSCGTALRLDLGPSEDYADEYDAWERAYKACTADRITRVAQAVGVVSVAMLIATLLAARTRRRELSGEPAKMKSPAGQDR